MNPPIIADADFRDMLLRLLPELPNRVGTKVSGGYVEAQPPLPQIVAALGHLASLAQNDRELAEAILRYQNRCR